MTPPDADVHADTTARTRWYRRVRYVVPLLVIAVVVAVVVALVVQDSDTTRPRSGNPYDEAYGSFEPVTRTGTGSGTIPMPAGDSAAGIITAQFEGPGALDVGFELETTYLSLITPPPGGGPYSGSVAYGPHTFYLYGNDGEVPDSLAVTADGTWEITIAPISSAEELPATVSGTDAVFLYEGDGAVLVVESPDRRGRALSVSQWGLDPGSGQYFSLHDGFAYLKTDRHTKTVHLGPGPSVVVIDAFYPWSARLE